MTLWRASDQREAVSGLEHTSCISLHGHSPKYRVRQQSSCTCAGEGGRGGGEGREGRDGWMDG